MFAAALPALVAGGASIVGQVLQNDSNSAVADKTNRFNAQQAQLNRDYQTEMSNTAYQRARKDMEAAGLNPILLASQGGASTPSGATAQGTTGAPRVNPLARAVSTARDAMIMDATYQKIRSDADLNRQLIQTSKSQSDLNRANAATSAVNARNLATQTPGLLKEQSIDQSTYGSVMRYLGRLNPFGHSAAAVVKAVK